MIVAADLDGTLSAYPDVLGDVLRALRQAGHTVQVVSGVDAKTVTQDDCNAKLEQLNALGLGDAWDSIVAIPKPHAASKAAYLESVGAELLIDNAIANVKTTAGEGIPSLLVWNTKVKKS